jgi:pyridoxamine 5'-phosphate oxidase
VASEIPSPVDVAALRRDYMQRGLVEADLAAEPITQFEAWFRDALSCQAIREPNAMVLSTVSPDGQPHARVMLLKGFGPEGFVFYTNYESDKARDLAAQPRAALTFPWVELERQVRIEGTVNKMARAAGETYFQTRPRGSRLGAWASAQSRVISGRDELEVRVAELEARFPGDIPMPENWGGYCVIPEQLEFWQGRTNRLHDRLRYRSSGSAWIIERLSP